jgi:hypothetical protein
MYDLYYKDQIKCNIMPIAFLNKPFVWWPIFLPNIHTNIVHKHLGYVMGKVYQSMV